MSSKVERSDPQLWERVKRDLTRSDKGGKPEQWSARKAQLAVQEYKRRGGGYRGCKPKDTSLEQSTVRMGARSPGRRAWNPASGIYAEESTRGANGRGIPHHLGQEASRFRAWQAAIRASRCGSPRRRRGTARVGSAATRRELTKAELYTEVRRRGLRGRSKMSKAELRASPRKSIVREETMTERERKEIRTAFRHAVDMIHPSAGALAGDGGEPVSGLDTGGG